MEVKDVLRRMKQAYSVDNIDEVALKLGVSKDTVPSWRKRKEIPEKHILKCSQMTMFSKEWLLTGEGNMKIQSRNNINELLSHAYVVTKLSMYASAGDGIENFDIAEIGQVLLDKELFRYAMNPKSLKIIQVKGDSMEPTIMDECHVVIDENKTDNVDAIYAICLGSQVLIKRLQFNHLNGTITIRSDNPNYEDQIYNPKESQVSLKILGKKVLIIQ